MPLEIEKKFLLKYLPEHLMTSPIKIQQGYMVNQQGILVRIRTYGEAAFLTIKSPTVKGIRKEYEYAVPQDDALEMLEHFCNGRTIRKTRYRIPHENFVWDLDIFSGCNNGLIVAEIELQTTDQPFPKPDWIGREVTQDLRYCNSNLIAYPFIRWPDNRSGR